MPTTSPADRIKSILGEFESISILSVSNDPEQVRRKLGELEASLAQVNSIVESARRLIGGAGAASAARRGRPRGQAVAAATTETGEAPARRSGRRKGRGLFKTGEFIIKFLTAHPKGAPPKDIAAALAVAAPGWHKSPVANVNTTLRRLKDEEQVKNNDGTWSIR